MKRNGVISGKLIMAVPVLITLLFFMGIYLFIVASNSVIKKPVPFSATSFGQDDVLLESINYGGTEMTAVDLFGNMLSNGKYFYESKAMFDGLNKSLAERSAKEGVESCLLMNFLVAFISTSPERQSACFRFRAGKSSSCEYDGVSGSYRNYFSYAGIARNSADSKIKFRYFADESASSEAPTFAGGDAATNSWVSVNYYYGPCLAGGTTG